MNTLVERVRASEFDGIAHFFTAGASVLEIGGGNGYQASIIARRGCNITSIDVPERPRPLDQHHPVSDYDGRNIPFPDDTFDVVFSSHVLEHVRSLTPLLGEMRRVLKPGGRAIHVLPSATWRLWTNVAHYVYAIKYLLGSRAMPGVAKVHTISGRVRQKGLTYVASRALFPGPHGEYGSSLAEIYYFSRRRWIRVFRRHGYAIESAEPNLIAYTGFGIFETASIEARRRAARFLGSSSITFILTDVDSVQIHG